MLPSKRCTNPTCPEANPQPHDAFYVARMGAQGYPILRGQCKVCERAKFRRWESSHKKERAAWRRGWVQRKRKRDPEWWSARMAYSVEWNRRSRGNTERRLTRTMQPSVEIMAASFGEWITHVLTRDDVTLRELAGRWGVSERTLYALRSGERRTVELATVEAALCADGSCLVSDLYDDQELAA